MLTAALHTTATLWDQSERLTKEAGLKTCDVQPRWIYFSKLRKNDFVSFAGRKQMQLEIILRRELSQFQKEKEVSIAALLGLLKYWTF